MSSVSSQPALWTISTLGQILIYSDTRIDPSKSPNEVFFYVGLEHIEKNTGKLDGATKALGREIRSSKSVFQPGDILYGKLRPYLNKVYLSKVDGVCSTDIWVLKNQPVVDPEYLTYYLRSDPVLRRVSQAATGANLPRINANTFNAIPIPLPSLSEQKEIVTFLKEIDAIRSLRQQANDKAKHFLPSLFQETFGDLRASSSEWEIDLLLFKVR